MKGKFYIKKILYFFRKEKPIYFHVPLHVLDKKQINNGMEKEFFEGGCAPEKLTGEYLQSVNRQRGKVLDGLANGDILTLAPIGKLCLPREFGDDHKKFVAIAANSKQKGALEFGGSHMCESFTKEDGTKVFRFGDYLSIAAACGGLAGKSFTAQPTKVFHQEFVDGKLTVDKSKTDTINVFGLVTVKK